MRNILVVPVVVAALAGISAFSFEQNGGYVLVNDDKSAANSLSGFKITAAGKISFLETLQTGGTGIGGGFFVAPHVVIESKAHCIFAADAGSSDIAAFEGPSFKRVVPNFSNTQLNGSVLGIGLAVDPEGKFLYSAWSATENIAVLAIASDCSLTLAGSPIIQPDDVVDLTVTHDGKVLVVGYPDLGGVQAYKTSSTGALTALGPQLVFATSISACATTGCFPAAQDVTDNDKYWVWGNATLSGASTLSATLTSQGFTNAALQTYPDTTLQNVESPWFSPAAAKTAVGNLYLGAGGFGTGYPAGIIVATFNSGTITYDSNIVNTAASYAGAVQTVGTPGTGSPLVQIAADSSFMTNILYSYTVNGTTLTPASTFKDPVTGGLAFSISAFPTRP
jgi:hypothetical protein